MSTSHQGIDNHNGEMQPSDKDHAQTAHKTSPDKSASHESTRESNLDDQPKMGSQLVRSIPPMSDELSGDV